MKLLLINVVLLVAVGDCANATWPLVKTVNLPSIYRKNAQCANFTYGPLCVVAANEVNLDTSNGYKSTDSNTDQTTTKYESR
jgi:hypothetical protein